MNREYSLNVIVSVLIALIVWILFAYPLEFGNQIYLVIGLFGLPHFLLAALGYFSKEPNKTVVPFSIATLLALTFGFFLKNLDSFYLVQLIFFGYFLIHLLKDEFMLEESAKSNYRLMAATIPNLTQLGLLLIPLFGFIFLGFNYQTGPIIKLPAYFALAFLVPTPFLLFGKSPQKPLGFTLFFISLLSLFFFWLGNQSFETGVNARAFLGLYHFATWYVFYTKRLARKPKIDQRLKFNFPNILFSYNKSPKNFWLYVGFVQMVTIGLLLIFLKSPNKFGTQYLFGEDAWQMWTIWHVTTSFVGKWQPAFALKSFWSKGQSVSALPA